MNIFLKINAIYNNPPIANAIAPTNSCFQEIIKTTSRISEGILCINNPKTVCQNVYSFPNTSNENNTKKARKIIDSILGVQ